MWARDAVESLGLRPALALCWRGTLLASLAPAQHMIVTSKPCCKQILESGACLQPGRKEPRSGSACCRHPCAHLLCPVLPLLRGPQALSRWLRNATAVSARSVGSASGWRGALARGVGAEVRDQAVRAAEASQLCDLLGFDRSKRDWCTRIAMQSEERGRAQRRSAGVRGEVTVTCAYGAESGGMVRAFSVLKDKRPMATGLFIGRHVPLLCSLACRQARTKDVRTHGQEVLSCNVVCTPPQSWLCL